MKQLIKILPAFCIMFIALFFAGCSINTPTLTVDGCLISWNLVGNATKYEVDVNGTSYFTTQNNYNLAPLIQKDRTIKEVKVRAITENMFLKNSPFSDIVSVAVGDKILAAPKNFNVQISTNSYICSWDAVENADYYCIKLVNKQTLTEKYFATSGRSYNLYGVTGESGEYDAYVFAYSNSQAHIYAPSDLTKLPNSFMMDVTLDTPGEVSLYYSSGNIMCSWPTVLEAGSYNLSILNGQTITDIPNDKNAVKQVLNLTEKGITLDAGETLFVCVGAVGEQNSGYLESPYTDMCSLYGNGTKADFSTVKYDFMGTQFDFVADSYTELEDAVWYALLYRINSIKCFFNYSTLNSSVANEFKKAVKAYNEICHINYQFFGNSDGSYTLKCTYINCIYPDKTAAQSSQQVSKMKPKNYTSTPRADTFDNFAIDSREKSAMVYTSDQLYFVIQEGYKPVFPEGESPAEIAYKEAKNVLRGIVSDDMSDYEKTLAIYEWVCFTAHYDHAVLEIDRLINQNLMEGESSDYRAFYVEGMLFDGGQAVCDGISKTFSLLCGLENIECYKAIGVSDAEMNSTQKYADHAWNKVKLDLVGNDGVGEWYTVDATQNDFSDAHNNEYLTHLSFLQTDEWMSTVLHHKELYPCKDVSSTEFNFYENSTYNGTNDLFISSTAELNVLATYTKSTLGCVEFVVDKNNFFAYNHNNIAAAFQKGTVSTVMYSRQIDFDIDFPYVIFIVYYDI